MKQLTFVLLLLALLITLTGCGGKQEADYQNAMDAMESGDYDKASKIFSELDDYQDAREKSLEAEYQYGEELYKKGDYEGAEKVLLPLGDRGKDLLSQVYFHQAQDALNKKDYDTAVSLFERVEGENAAQASRMVGAIQNLDTINEIIQEIHEKYCLRDSPIYNSYLEFFGLDFTFDLHYELPENTFYFEIYYPQSLSSLATLFGASLEDDKPDQSDGMDRDLYMEFYNRGMEGVTVKVSRHEKNGTLLSAFTYTPEDYQREMTEEASKWNGDFRIEDGVLTLYTGSEARPVLPDSVTAIGKRAFAENQTLEEIILPPSIISVQSQAFLNCGNLRSVTFSENLEEIEGEAFQGCGLTSLHLPKTLETVGAHAFMENNITSVTFEEGATVVPAEIGALGFSLEEVAIPEGVQSIGPYAFSQPGLRKLHLPSTLREVGTGALSNLEETEITFAGTTNQWAAVSGYFQKENVRCRDGLYSSYPFYTPTGQEVSMTLSEFRSRSDVYAYEGEMVLITDCVLSGSDGYQSFTVCTESDRETERVSTQEDSSTLWYNAEGRPPVFQEGDSISFYGRVAYNVQPDWSDLNYYLVTAYFEDAVILAP